MENKGLTLGIIFSASSANYGEGVGNISELKKITKNSQTYTRISRQALAYDLRTQLSHRGGYELAPVTEEEEKNKVESKVGDESVEQKESSKKSVIQFHPDATIEKYPEMDLFGYMRTKDKSAADTRAAVARLTDATSLSPYSYDFDFLTNKGLADRVGRFNSIANIEVHSSLYEYTVTIDLDDVGVLDGEDKISNKEKAKRVCAYLRTVEKLYRDIKGRRENLGPVFVIGGIYPVKNNYFNGRLCLKKDDLAINILRETIEETDIKENTRVGLLSDVFPNESDIRKSFKEDNVEVLTIHQYFEKLCKEVEKYYGEEEGED